MLTGDEAQFGVHLMFRQPVDNAAAGILKHLGVIDIVLFIKSCPQLQEAENILSPICGIGKCSSDLAAGGHAVKGDFD